MGGRVGNGAKVQMQFDNKLNAAIFINEEKSETLNQDWEIKLSSAFTPELHFFRTEKKKEKTFSQKNMEQKGGDLFQSRIREN